MYCIHACKRRKGDWTWPSLMYLLITANVWEAIPIHCSCGGYSPKKMTCFQYFLSPYCWGRVWGGGELDYLAGKFGKNQMGISGSNLLGASFPLGARAPFRASCCRVCLAKLPRCAAGTGWANLLLNPAAQVEAVLGSSLTATSLRLASRLNEGDQWVFIFKNYYFSSWTQARKKDIYWGPLPKGPQQESIGK